ncbi:MAG: DNA repair protein RecO [Rhizobiales bacterium]|nr:DNA repair protein RecO [Hyphomicrobiales bacterium]
MEWTEEALILGVRKHGETSVILEVMTQARGRARGLIRGGRSRRLQPVLQAGNRVRVTWRARLEDHLGVFTIEPVELRAARLMETGVGLHGIQVLAAHLRLLPERDPHPALVEAAEVVIGNLDDAMVTAVLLIRFELALLDELGFGLDLSVCAATGGSQDLAYVSPKSGRAVSRAAGAPYHDRMLPLPAFLLSGRAPQAFADIADAFRLTGYFLHRHIYDPRSVKPPLSRETLSRDIERVICGNSAG